MSQNRIIVREVRTMKKILLLCTMLCLLLSVVGCGKVAQNNPAATNLAQAEKQVNKGNMNMVSGTTDKTTEMKVRITAGNHVITAKLYDNAASKALWNKLPLKLPMMNLYGREMCYRFGKGGLPSNEAADVGYKVGDISYWPPAGSLVILYKQNGEVFEQQPIGHIDSDISFFDGMPNTDIVFEKVK